MAVNSWSRSVTVGQGIPVLWAILSLNICFLTPYSSCCLLQETIQVLPWTSQQLCDSLSHRVEPLASQINILYTCIPLCWWSLEGNCLGTNAYSVHSGNHKTMQMHRICQGVHAHARTQTATACYLWVQKKKSTPNHKGLSLIHEFDQRQDNSKKWKLR